MSGGRWFNKRRRRSFIFPVAPDYIILAIPYERLSKISKTMRMFF
jgi:hypothetical protein